MFYLVKMRNTQFSELSMVDMNLSNLNDEELRETQGGIWQLIVGFVWTVAFEMGVNDGAKNRDK